MPAELTFDLTLVDKDLHYKSYWLVALVGCHTDNLAQLWNPNFWNMTRLSAVYLKYCKMTKMREGIANHKLGVGGGEWKALQFKFGHDVAQNFTVFCANAVKLWNCNKLKYWFFCDLFVFLFEKKQ